MEGIEGERSEAGMGRVNSGSSGESPVGDLDGQSRKHWERAVC